MPDFGIIRALATGAKRAKVARGAMDVAAANKGAAADTVAEMARLDARISREEAPQTAPAAEPISQPLPQPAQPIAPAAGAERATTREGLQAEAERISKLNLGEYDLEQTHQINFDQLTTTDEVKAVIADAAVLNKDRIDVARRGEIGNEQLKLLAADLNTDEDVVKQVMERESGGVLNPETVLAARQVLAQSANRVLDLGKKIASGQGTDLDKLKFRRQILFHDDYQTAFMGARAETGRALNAFNIPVGAELDGQAVAKLARTVENLNGHDTEQLAKMISQLESVGQVSKFTKEYTRSKLQGVVQELFVSSILSGPKTQVVNAVGNALFQAANSVEMGVAAQVGKIMPGAAHVEAGEATAMLFGQLTGWRDAMRYAKISIKNGASLDEAAKYEGHTTRAISSKNLFPEGAPPSLAAAIDMLGHVIRAPIDRLMIPADEFFKTLATRADLARQAYLEVLQRTAGGQEMSGDEIAAFVQKFMERPSVMARHHADDFSKYVTFQNELGIAGQKAQSLVAATPGGFVIAPFVKTPTNIFKAGLLERSPLAAFTKKFWSTIAAGGPERDLAVARVAMGSLTVGAVAALTMNGEITGGGPQDPGARSLLEATGWQPYSIKVGDTYQSYARAEPFSYVIGSTADLVEIRSFMDTNDPLATDDENMNRAIASVTAAVANNTLSKTFMSGIADFSQALDDPTRYMGDWVARTSLAFLPYSAFRRQIGQMQDPLIREAWDYTDKVKAGSGLAGYSEGMPPRRDMFGTPKRYAAGSMLGAMSPFPDKKDKHDPVADEVAKVMQETRAVPITMPSKRIEGMKLTAKEYDQLVIASRRNPDPNGESFKDSLRTLFASEAYSLATPDYKAVLIKQVKDQHDEVGRATLYQEDPIYASRLDVYRMKKGQLMGAGQ